MYRLIGVFSWIILTTGVLAQESYDIRGTIVDSATSEPVARAVISVASVTDSTSSSFDYFDYTDNDGRFTIQGIQRPLPIVVRVRHMSYRQVEKIIRDPNPDIQIKVSYEPQSIPDIVVSDKRPPVVEREDTVIYNVEDFIDSTEFNVEDILKKIPGIRVLDNGEVEVDGKQISKLFIEDDDLFGGQYTMGTKNIRANAIDRVEVIHRFQDNPVLKDIVRSEEVALNLKLKPDMIGIINGTGFLGQGMGIDKEYKADFHGNLFYISRAFKSIILSSMGNTGNQHSPDDYFGFGGGPSQNVEDPVSDFLSLQQPVTLSNPGVEADYIDNSRTHFNTLRNHFRLNDKWKMTVHGLLGGASDAQNSGSQSEFFQENTTYATATENINRRKNNLGEVEASLRYLSPDNGRRVVFFSRYVSRRHRGENEMADLISNLSLFNSQNQRFRLGQLAVQWTEKLSDNVVFDYTMKGQINSQSETMSATHFDYPAFFDINDTSLQLYDQGLDYRYRGGLAKFKLFGTTLLFDKKLNWEFSGSYQRDALDRDALQTLSSLNQLKNDTIVHPPDTTFHIHRGDLSGSINYSPVKKHWFTFSSTLNSITAGHENSLIPTLRLQWLYEPNSRRSLRVIGQYSVSGKSNAMFDPVFFLQNTFNYTTNFIEDLILSKYDIRLVYIDKKLLKFRNMRFSIGYQKYINSLLSDFDFRGQITQRQFVTGPGSERINMSYRYSKFYVGIKSQIEAQVASSYTLRPYFVSGSRNVSKLWYYSANLTVRHTMAGRFNASIEARFSGTTPILKGGQSSTNTTLVKLTPSVSYRTGPWMTSIKGGFHSVSGFAEAQFITLEAQVQRGFTLFDKDALLIFKTVNLTNQKSLQTSSIDPQFSYISRTEGIPLYFMMKLDMTF